MTAASNIMLVLTTVLFLLAVIGTIVSAFPNPDVLNIQQHEKSMAQAVQHFQNKEENILTTTVPSSRDLRPRNILEIPSLQASDTEEKTNTSPLTVLEYDEFETTETTTTSPFAATRSKETGNVPNQTPLHSSDTQTKTSALSQALPGKMRKPFGRESSDLTKVNFVDGNQPPQLTVNKPLMQLFRGERNWIAENISPKVFHKDQQVDLDLDAMLDSDCSNFEAGHSSYHGSWVLDTNCTVKRIHGDIACDCSWLGLTGVPQDLPLIINCTRLYLDYNVIRSITNVSFLGYSTVKVLNLENNFISKLHPDSFVYFTSLVHLNLRNNSLPMINGTFPEGTFRPLSDSQTYLNIARNNPEVFNKSKSLEYPVAALLDLPHLQELYMDGLYNKSFQKEFQKLKNLRLLNLCGYKVGFCRLDIITRETFRYLGQLHTLNISDCYADKRTVESGVFASLTKLEVLDISWNNFLDIDCISRILKSWPQCKLTELYMNFVVRRYSSNRHISRQHVDSLPRTLQVLEVLGNSLATIDPDVFENLPKNLTRLVVGGNRFIFGCYLKNMSLMENLEELVLDGDGNVYKLPTSYPGSDQVSDLLTDTQPSCDDSKSTQLVINLPPKLKTLSMRSAGFAYSITQLHIDSNNTLQNLHIDGNHFPYLGGPIFGLHHLINLTAEECGIQNIQNKFFSEMASLQSLDLGNNLLGFDMSGNSTLSLFQNLTNLKFLNLSFNAIHMMGYQPNFFKGLNNLEELLMFNNRLWYFNMNISHMNNLRILNLTDTSLTTLNKDIQDHIDSIFSNTSIQADLSQNPIFCTCDNLDFLKWLAQSNAFNKSLHSETYMCLFPGSVYRYMYIHDGYAEIIKTLTKECTSRYVLFLYTCGGTLLCVCFIIVVIVYRFRWNLRYLYYAAYLSLKKKRSEMSVDFKYDVFLCYAEEDDDFVLQSVVPELENRKLRILIHGRDFKVGRDIFSNIVDAVKESRKTLVVLTRALLESSWCKNEIQMANMESVYTGRQVLVFMIKESIPCRDLDRDLLCHIRKNTYIEYPQPDEFEESLETLQPVFWNKLANDLSD